MGGVEFVEKSPAEGSLAATNFTDESDESFFGDAKNQLIEGFLVRGAQVKKARIGRDVERHLVEPLKSPILTRRQTADRLKTHFNFAFVNVRFSGKSPLLSCGATSLIGNVFLVNLRRFIFALYLALIVGIALAGGLYFMEAREEFSRLKTIQAESRRRIAEAEVRLKYQEQVLERLRADPAYVEKVIRRKLGYARPEEYVFRFEN